MVVGLQYRCTQTLAVDIHPAARIGKGVLLDHGTGLVIGETAVVGNNVSILHNVTLGGGRTNMSVPYQILALLLRCLLQHNVMQDLACSISKPSAHKNCVCMYL